MLSTLQTVFEDILCAFYLPFFTSSSYMCVFYEESLFAKHKRRRRRKRALIIPSMTNGSDCRMDSMMRGVSSSRATYREARRGGDLKIHVRRNARLGPCACAQFALIAAYNHNRLDHTRTKIGSRCVCACAFDRTREEGKGCFSRAEQATHSLLEINQSHTVE